MLVENGERDGFTDGNRSLDCKESTTSLSSSTEGYILCLFDTNCYFGGLFVAERKNAFASGLSFSLRDFLETLNLFFCGV